MLDHSSPWFPLLWDSPSIPFLTGDLIYKVLISMWKELWISRCVLKEKSGGVEKQHWPGSLETHPLQHSTSVLRETSEPFPPTGKGKKQSFPFSWESSEERLNFASLQSRKSFKILPRISRDPHYLWRATCRTTSQATPRETGQPSLSQPFSGCHWVAELDWSGGRLEVYSQCSAKSGRWGKSRPGTGETRAALPGSPSTAPAGGQKGLLLVLNKLPLGKQLNINKQASISALFRKEIVIPIGFAPIFASCLS